MRSIILCALLLLTGCAPRPRVFADLNQNNFMSWDAAGNLTVTGDGTSAFTVHAEGGETGWKFDMTSDPQVAGAAIDSAFGAYLEAKKSDNEALKHVIDVVAKAAGVALAKESESEVDSEVEPD